MLVPQTNPVKAIFCSKKFAYIVAANYVRLRACLHGGGRPQIGEVTCGGSPHLSCKRN